MSKSLNQKQGVVVSISGDKTIKVQIRSRKEHAFYKKIVNTSSSFLVHDEEKKANVGDLVVFKLCRPISLKKKWRLVKIVGGSQ